MAKVTDFGYSTIFSTDDDQIAMPKSGLWTAPEYHHRQFLPKQARKMDVYSFGILCLWVLFYNNRANRDRNFKKDLEDTDKELTNYASELLEATLDLENRERHDLQRVFRSTLARDPAQRAANLNELLELLSPNRSERLLFWKRISYLTPLTDGIAIPHEDFRVSLTRGFRSCKRTLYSRLIALSLHYQYISFFKLTMACVVT